MALQVGNAVPPPLTAAVGRAILEMEAQASVGRTAHPAAGDTVIRPSRDRPSSSSAEFLYLRALDLNTELDMSSRTRPR